MQRLISHRFKQDSHPAFPLSPNQRRARDLTQEKLSSGYYSTETVDCYNCGSKEHTTISHKDTYGLSVNVVICDQCELIFNNPRLSEESAFKLYTEHYHELDRAHKDLDEYYQREWEKGKQILNFLKAHSLDKRLRSGVIVDIGCGAGGVVGFFKSQNFECVGSDFVPENILHARYKGIDVVKGGLDSIIQSGRLENKSISLIIYEQVFEHLTAPKNEATKIRSLMNQDSLLYIAVPGVRNILKHYRADFLRYLQVVHFLHFDLCRLAQLLQQLNLQLLHGNEKIQAVFSLSDSPQVNSISYIFNTRLYLTIMEGIRGLILISLKSYRLSMKAIRSLSSCVKKID